MIRSIIHLTFSGFLLLACFEKAARTQGTLPDRVDVLHYGLELEPNINTKSVKGSVVIRFVFYVSPPKTVEFSCGDLVIDSVRQQGAERQFEVTKGRLRIALQPGMRANEVQEIEIQYHGSPKRGIRFFPDRNQVYTIFSTSQWMVCVDDPDDKATLNIKLIIPANLTAVTNGRFVGQRDLPDKKVLSQWAQSKPIPTYIFGFAIGPFREVTEKHGHVEFRYLSTGFSDDQVRRIFRDTPDMVKFFEERAGVVYPNPTYTQVLAAGVVEQEMDGFAALPEDYGKRLLANEQDVWLSAHELAHQWWGNMVTCRDWNHFWLNEGIADFIASAYIERRFGRASYLRRIEDNRANYERVRRAGKDRSLVFPDWLNPSREDRTLVYDKGAYVMHLLREEMGERDFWNGLRSFTRHHFGKSVETPDFTKAMQEATEKDLTSFFAKWIYLQTE